MFNNNFQTAQQLSQKNIWDSSDGWGWWEKESNVKVSVVYWLITNLFRPGLLLVEHRQNWYPDYRKHREMKICPRVGCEGCYWLTWANNMTCCLNLFIWRILPYTAHTLKMLIYSYKNLYQWKVLPPALNSPKCLKCFYSEFL